MACRLRRVAGVFVAALACASPNVAHMEPVLCEGICSDGSGYAPVAQLFVTHARLGDSLTVRVDSGMLGMPTLRPAASFGPVLASALTLRAFVAQSAEPTSSTADQDAKPTGHGWRLIAQGAAQPLASSLSAGEVRPVSRTEFTVILPPGTNTARVWLGFEIAGDATDTRDDSKTHRPVRGGVRVYVCDPRTLAGALDSLRVRRLRVAYGAAC